jgi:hypothetical protein
MVLIFIFDLVEIVEVKGQKLDRFVNFGSLLFTPIIVVCNLFLFKIRRFTLLICIPSVCLTVVFVTIVSRVGMFAYLFSVGSYQTQTILYENTSWGSKTIEFQMQNVGVFGYNERYVEVTYLTPWFMITDEVDPDEKRGKEWIKMDKEVNELNLKY